MKNKLRFAVIGAGNGGLATAGDLALMGFEVSLNDIVPEALAAVSEKGGIEMVGSVRSGFAPIVKATPNLAEAVKDANVIIVVTTANAHESVAKSLAPLVTEGQIIVLSPGYFGGSLIFKKELDKVGAEKIDIVELRLLPYAARMVGPGSVGIKGIKKIVSCAALPASRTEAVLKVLKPIFTWMEPMSNILEVGINNTNPIGHVPLTLLSLTAIENMDQREHFDFDAWTTTSSKNLTEVLDQERLQIAKAFGFPQIPRGQWLKLSYTKKKEIHKRVGKVPESSASVPPRYITEDVPMGLIPLSELGKQFGIPTPVCDALITISSAAKGINFYEEARTLEKLGLNGLSPQEMIAKVK